MGVALIALGMLKLAAVMFVSAWEGRWVTVALDLLLCAATLIILLTAGLSLEVPQS